MKKQDYYTTIIIILLFVVGVSTLVGLRIFQKNQTKEAATQVTTESQVVKSNDKKLVSWSNDGRTWKSSATPPVCDNPIRIVSPVDLTKVSSIIYPGQVRDGNYDSAGGFVFQDNSNETISVNSPLAASVMKANRYLEQNKTRYIFEFITPCGILYRLDRLSNLSAPFQNLADTLPAAVENIKTLFVPGSLLVVNAGDLIATTGGLLETGKIIIGFGLYDIRSRNTVTNKPEWQKAHSERSEYSPYGMCWTNVFKPKDRDIIGALPVEGITAKQSDYCG